MAVVLTSGIVDEIHGSIGGTNFYKHGAFQCVRTKPIAKRRHTPKQASFTAAIMQKKIDWEFILDGPYQHWFEEVNSGLVNTRHGINYTFPLYQYVVKFGLLNRLFFNWFPFPEDNLYGPVPELDLTMELQDCPNYARIVISRAMILGEALYFWWDYPWNKQCNQGLGTYPFSYARRNAGAGPFALSGPRITGRSEIHYKWRLFTTRTGLGPIQKGIARKDNWQ